MKTQMLNLSPGSILLFSPTSALCDGGDTCCDGIECGVSVVVDQLIFGPLVFWGVGYPVVSKVHDGVIG